MRAASRVAFVAWFVVSAGGCAAITGLDSISEQECATNCGKDAQSSGGDVTVETSSGGNDSTAPESASGNDTGPADSNGPQETSTPVDASEAGTKDSPNDVANDVPPDTTSFSDAPFDSGCGDLNTTANCSACGDKCASTSTSVTSASCTGPNNGAGATCSYTCATGYLDCDKDTNPPDLNGCECHSPGATQSNCGNGQNGPQGCCPVQHSDGLSANATFYDCNPATSGTTGYTVGLATDACTQFTGNQADCGAGECTNANDAGTGDFVVCGQTSATSECVCWEYMGPNVGKVTTATGSILGQCLCPGSTGTGIQTFNYD